MSRLDDELKLAFRREQPSADFTAQVLARIAAQSKPQKLSLWQRLIGLFQMPTMRWAIAGAAILLIAAISIVQYQRSNHRDEATQIAGAGDAAQGNNKSEIKKAPDENPAPKITPPEEQRKVQAVAYKVKRKPLPRRFKTSSVVPEGPVAKGNPKAMSERERGEQAKEQLFKALAITSSLLSEARSVAFGDK